MGGGGGEMVMGSAISIPQCYLALSPLWGWPVYVYFIEGVPRGGGEE